MRWRTPPISCKSFAQVFLRFEDLIWVRSASEEDYICDVWRSHHPNTSPCQTSFDHKSWSDRSRGWNVLVPQCLKILVRYSIKNTALWTKSPQYYSKTIRKLSEKQTTIIPKSNQIKPEAPKKQMCVSIRRAVSLSFVFKKYEHKFKNTRLLQVVRIPWNVSMVSHSKLHTIPKNPKQLF